MTAVKTKADKDQDVPDTTTAKPERTIQENKNEEQSKPSANTEGTTNIERGASLAPSTVTKSLPQTEADAESSSQDDSHSSSASPSSPHAVERGKEKKTNSTAAH
ncbi:PREDICTED: uncharacterized protein LOC109586782 [Amphimedon queenslandica]|uniref:Uncharacterized protein n=1 Tax=Amphimedon queenslandica TaxID=400682 RepID=A0AAN0JNE0_AMPQE|nr:PREDICTED: uncharacterized protein LOC109586782 [Amphimedon queenslandica]|eukprot:XP_019858549.1 PREDICTED: uncharacterized protein LOC109586782 [Amphimedon queenslandica]